MKMIGKLWKMIVKLWKIWKTMETMEKNSGIDAGKYAKTMEKKHGKKK